MVRSVAYKRFAQVFSEALPSAELVEDEPAQFWNDLAVNTERTLSTMVNPDSNSQQLSSIGLAGLRALAFWRGLDISLKKSELISALAQNLADNHTDEACRIIVLMATFMQNRRPDSIETISRAILPHSHFELVDDKDKKSKRFCYGLLVYFHDPRSLRFLYLYENAEKAGYIRCRLVPLAERNKQPLHDDLVHAAELKIRDGADLSVLDVDRVNEILDDYELRHGRYQSRCFDVFEDASGDTTLIFILRYLREASIREVDGVVFADEAELIVLRLKDQARTLEEHGISKAARSIAVATASNLLDEPNLRYIEDTQLTKGEQFERLIQVLVSGKLDKRLRLHELYLANSAIVQAPILILRCDSREDLSRPIRHLRRRRIDLLQDYGDIRNIKIAFVIQPGEPDEKAYSFKVFCHLHASDRFYLPYSVSNIPTRIRTDFELYLLDNYNVQVIPGTGRGTRSTRRASPSKRAQTELFPELDRYWLARVLKADIRLDPGDPAVEVLDDLEDLGLISITKHQFLRCAYQGDSDYPALDVEQRNCVGRIPFVKSSPDGHECPVCGRLVEHMPPDKTLFSEYQIRLQIEGIKEYVGRALWNLKVVKRPDFPSGPRIDIELANGHDLRMEIVTELDRPSADTLYLIASSAAESADIGATSLHLSDFLSQDPAYIRLIWEKAVTSLLVARQPRMLKEILREHFNMDELRELCFDLGINFDEIPGERLTRKATELIDYVQRHNRLAGLVRLIQMKRPQLALLELLDAE